MLAGIRCMGQKKKVSLIFNNYTIWHVTFFHKETVCGILCMWVAFIWLFQTSMYMLFVVFSFCYTLNHQFKGEKRLLKHLFHLDKDHIFWIHFEFSSSDGKLVKFCTEPKIWKIATKFSVPLLSHDHAWEPKPYIFEHISEMNSQNCGAKRQATVFT